VYNQILTAECTQLNGTWPDPDDPRWNSGEYAELLPDWFPTNATNISAFGNATISPTLGNVIEIKLYVMRGLWREFASKATRPLSQSFSPLLKSFRKRCPPQTLPSKSNI